MFRFGSLLASCSYDRRVIVWQEGNGQWNKIHEYTNHDSSVNRQHNHFVKYVYISVIYFSRHYGISEEKQLFYLADFSPKYCFIDTQIKEQVPFLFLVIHRFDTQKTLLFSIAWAPHDLGLSLVCGSSDGAISVLTYTSRKRLIYALHRLQSQVQM